MATVKDLDALNQTVTDIMLRHYGNQLAKIILYGSYARGDFHDESDVDYIVALDRESVSPLKELKTYSTDFYDLFLDKQILVSAFTVPLKQLQQPSKAIFTAIEREGKTVYERSDTGLH